MKKSFVIIFLGACVCYACTLSKVKTNASAFLKKEKLQEQIFSINTNKDTNLNTKGGIKLFIKANSIKSATVNVSLLVKEALDIATIIQAGLTTTTTDGKLLSSDGMFYISTKEESKILQPIQIEIPSMRIDKDMMLYKGREENNVITWENPETIKNTIDTSADGEKLFKINCSSCHAINKPLTGPALAGIDKRWPNRIALVEYIRDNTKFLFTRFLHDFPHLHDSSKSSLEELFSEEKIYASQLYCNYNGVPMTTFKDILNTKEINVIIDYINNESNKLSLPVLKEVSDNTDSCYYFFKNYLEIKNSYSEMRDSLLKNNGKLVETKITEAPDANPMNDNGVIPVKVSPQSQFSEYYQFSITAYGWYNVDVLVLEKFGSVESQLSVEINSTIATSEIYLIIPSLKVFTKAGKLNNEKWGFYNINGSIPLPQNLEAYIIGLGEKDSKSFFGKTKFVTQPNQNIIIDINETTLSHIKNQMANLQLSDFEIDIQKTKNFESLKKLDDRLKNIEDKLQNCIPCLYNKNQPSVK